MKARLLLIEIALAIVFAAISPLTAYAFSLGPITVEGEVEKTFTAIITADTGGASGLKAEIGTEADYKRLGIERPPFADVIEVTVMAHPVDPLQSIIRLTSTKPVFLPSFNLVVRAVLGDGVILENYFIALDFQKNIAMELPAEDKRGSAKPILDESEDIEQLEADMPAASDTKKPVEAKPAKKPPVELPTLDETPAPDKKEDKVHVFTDGKPHRVPGQSAGTPTGSPKIKAEPAIPAGAKISLSEIQTGSLAISKGDSLYKLTTQMGLTGIDRARAVLAIWQLNKDKFIQGNIHGIRAGTKLDLTDVGKVAQTIDSAEAAKLIGSMWGEWKTDIRPALLARAGAPVSATAASTASAGSATSAGEFEPISPSGKKGLKMEFRVEPRAEQAPSAPEAPVGQTAPDGSAKSKPEPGTAELPFADFIAKLKSTGLAEERLPVEKRPVDVEAVRKLLADWKTSWESGDLDKLMSLYSESFTEDNLNRAEWREVKRKFGEKHKNMTVGIRDVKLSWSGPLLKVAFLQQFKSDSLDSLGIKTIELAQEKDGFKIVSEKWSEGTNLAAGDVTSKHPFVIHAASYKDYESALAETNRLRALGYPAYILHSSLARLQEWHRVGVGRFASKNEAEQTAKQMSNAGAVKFYKILHLPFAVSAGSFEKPTDASAEAGRLREKFYSPYILQTIDNPADPGGKSVSTILLAAFESKSDAVSFVEIVKTDVLTAKDKTDTQMAGRLEVVEP